MADVTEISERIRKERESLEDLFQEMGRVIVGQKKLVEGLVTGLLADGHVLLEGVPGLAKTLAVSTLAQAVGGTFKRIQFTPDLLPADLTGTHVYNPASGEWNLKLGPLFANLVLADEVNRSPAKVQSALLEAMQERQVTLGGETRALPSPYLVLATQNPIEQEGTYPLPEAQLDRFMLKIVVDYPDKEEEARIVDRMAATQETPRARQVTTLEKILELRKLLDAVYLDDKIKAYVVELVHATRRPAEKGLAELAPLIRYGASPRASIFLCRAARARAFLKGRGWVTPQDVKDSAMDVLRHRVLVSWEAEAEEKTSEDVIEAILDAVEVP